MITVVGVILLLTGAYFLIKYGVPAAGRRQEEHPLQKTTESQSLLMKQMAEDMVWRQDVVRYGAFYLYWFYIRVLCQSSLGWLLYVITEWMTVGVKQPYMTCRLLQDHSKLSNNGLMSGAFGFLLAIYIFGVT